MSARRTPSADAARYQWLRHHFTEVRAIGRATSQVSLQAEEEACIGDEEDGKALDAAIDRAMQVDADWGKR